MNGNRKLLKHLLAFIVVLFTLFTFISVSVSAESDIPEIRYTVSSGNNALDNLPDADSLKSYLIAETVKCSERIDLSAYNIPQSYINDILNFLSDDVPELFHITGEISYAANGDKLSYIEVRYSMTKNEYAQKLTKCVSAAEEILDGIRGNSALTDVQKALLIHDRLALHCQYYDLGGKIPEDCYTMYGTLVNGVAVCQGYSETYEYLLEQVGIGSYICSSDQLNHEWNMVIINGKKYHVDVTWDDPLPDKTGQVLHTNFLLSDDGIRKLHAANDFETGASDKTYDNYFWQSSFTAFQMIDNELYYVDNTQMNDREIKTAIKKYSDKSELYTLTAIWHYSSTGYYPDGYSCLGSNGKELFFNTDKDVYKFDVKTGTATKVWSPVIPSQGYYNIYGFRYTNGKFICDVYNDANYNSVTKKANQQVHTYDSSSDSSVASVSVHKLPAKIVYYLGDKFDSAGLELTVKTVNGNTFIKNNGFVVNGFDSTTVGKKTLTVVYENVSTTFQIEVKTPKMDIVKDSITLDENLYCDIEYKTEPSGCKVTWASSDPDFLAVSASGAISVNMNKFKESVTLTGSFVYNGKIYSDTCKVSVTCAHKGMHYIVEAEASTCVKQGHGKYTLCATCNKVISGSDALLPLSSEHVYGKNADGKYLVTTATCIKGAEYTVSCNMCGVVGTEIFNDGIVDSLNHTNIEMLKPVEPCVDKDGLTPGEKCADCGVILSEQMIIPAGTQHSFETVVVEPDCINKGYTVHTCVFCLHEEITDYVDAKGHSFGGWIVVREAQGDEEGIEERVCVNCGEIQSRTSGSTDFEILVGDLNSDGRITAADARLVLRISAGLDTLEKVGVSSEVADYNADTKITAADARLVLRKAAGLD